jgi:APA family basic amino acid/polyamine antiporter
MRHGKLNAGRHKKISYKIVSMTGFGLVAILISVAGLHHASAETNDNGLFYFSIAFAILHVVFYIAQLTKARAEQVVPMER